MWKPPLLINQSSFFPTTESHVLWNELINKKDPSWVKWHQRTWRTPAKVMLWYQALKTFKRIRKTVRLLWHQNCSVSTFLKEKDTEAALAADAYLTFIAFIHQVYIQQCFLHLWHTPAPIITPPNLGSITVFQQTIVAFLTWFQKNKERCSRVLDKNCNRPWPWAQFHFFYYKMEKEGKVSVSGFLYTFVEDIKAKPIPWIV